MLRAIVLAVVSFVAWHPPPEDVKYAKEKSE